MSSVIFQPLLHDPLGWKASNTTYADHYQWRKQRLTRKDKFVSPYGQKHQRQLQRKKEQPAPVAYRSTPSLAIPAKIDEEPIPHRIASVKKTEEETRRPSGSSKSTRQASSKSLRLPTPEESSPRINLEHPAAAAASRAASVHRENSSFSRASQRSTQPVVATEDVSRPATRLERRSAQRDETAKSIVDANNDDSRHWLTYPNPKTPQNIIDSKIRLGQMKAPAIVARAKSALYGSLDDTLKSVPSTDRTESISVPQPTQKPKSPDQRHFLDFNLPDTPDDLRAARYRIDKGRYNPSLDSYPSRPQTCPDRLAEHVAKPPTPPVAFELPTVEAAPPNNVQEPSGATSDEPTEQSTSEQENVTVVIQPLNTEGVPSEYVEALETANVVQDEYMKLLKQNAEKKSEQFVYRLAAMPAEAKNHSSSAHRQRQQASPAPSVSSQSSLRQQDFIGWVRQATDQERHTAMKILHDVLTKPVTNEEILPSSIPSASRSRSGARKLGRVRTQPRFLPDQNDQEYIQQDVWNITRSDGMITTHPHPGSKSSVVQI